MWLALDLHSSSLRQYLFRQLFQPIIHSKCISLIYLLPLILSFPRSLVISLSWQPLLTKFCFIQSSRHNEVWCTTSHCRSVRLHLLSLTGPSNPFLEKCGESHPITSQLESHWCFTACPALLAQCWGHLHSSHTDLLHWAALSYITNPQLFVHIILCLVSPFSSQLLTVPRLLLSPANQWAPTPTPTQPSPLQLLTALKPLK